MNITLVVEKGSARSTTVRLRSPETLIGRRRGCDLRIPSAEVSRRHCLLAVRDGVLTVEDLDSVNGTFLNGRPVRDTQPVQPGDRLQVGPVCFRVDYHPEETRTGRRATGTGPHQGATAAPAARPDADGDDDLKPLDVVAEAGDADTPYDVVAAADEAESWNLPESNELRDLLTQMDDQKTRHKGD